MKTTSETLIATWAGALGRSPMFAALDAASLQVLAASGQIRHWTAGNLIFQRGDEGSFMLVVSKGKVRLSISTPQGRELVLRVVGAGEVIGELALIDGQPRSADATAIVETTGLVLRRDMFLKFATRHPQVGMSLARYLSSVVRSTNFQMESIALFDLQRRLVRFILFALQQIHGADIPDEATLTLEMNQTDLSAILGASRPKVNHALQLLVADGVLRRDGPRMICRRDRLEALALGAEDLI